MLFCDNFKSHYYLLTWLPGPCLRSFLFIIITCCWLLTFFSPLLINPSNLLPFIFSPPPTPALAVCGKSHQWASGADVQVSGGDQHSYPGETGPGREGVPAGGAQRRPCPGPVPSVGFGWLRPQPVWLWRPAQQWRTYCARRETWWMNSSSPSSPIISSPPLLPLFNKSAHHRVFGHFRWIKTNSFSHASDCVCRCCWMPWPLHCSGSCRDEGPFSKYFHAFEGLQFHLKSGLISCCLTPQVFEEFGRGNKEKLSPIKMCFLLKSWTSWSDLMWCACMVLVPLY